MKEIMYAEFADEVQELLRHTHEIVVATCDKNRVTARTVYCLCDGLQIYFITSKAYTKYKQLLKNPQVALAINQIQIEGTAHILGHPASEENAPVRQLCERDPVYQEYYHQYSKYKNSVFIRIRPQVITVYHGKGASKTLNVEAQKATQKGRC
jgi:uncharacterized pyridoxamine 5'-phosphate oxidase family protein